MYVCQVRDDRMTTWIKELIADPIICAESCCRSGFERAGIGRAGIRLVLQMSMAWPKLVK